jgi:dissimilatory sulfite reductase (desulfoviridin) alpha/beta subunit
MNNILKLNPNGTVTLCARKTCCPVMQDLGNGKIKITDDNGNSIVIEQSQAELIGDGLKVIKGSKEELLCE